MTNKRTIHKIKRVISVAVCILLAVFVLLCLWREGAFDGILGREGAVRVLGDDKAYFHFLDVGQGDSTLIISGEGAVLIDTGSVSQGEWVAAYVNECTRSLDYLILTHPHEDHMGGASAVLREVEVKNVIMPDAASDAAFFLRFLDLAEEQGINVIEATPGDVYAVGEMFLTLLAPWDTEAENRNNVSVVTRVDVGNTAALFTGDAEWEVEEALLAENPAMLDCDLYHAGHHGSSSSSTAAFLEAVSPSVAVISCGRDNGYGHPHREVLSALAALDVAVFRTDLEGNLIFASDGETISAYP